MQDRRIIFVPGMKPKPPSAVHRHELLRAIASGLARVQPELADAFTEETDVFQLVSWTYAFYGRHADIEVDRPGIERLLRSPEPNEADIAEIESLARKVARWVRILGDAMPWFGSVIAKPDMRLTMSEARRYLSNRRGVARAIRSMVKTELQEAWRDSCRVLLIGHSLGSVIAYESLWELSHVDKSVGRVELFVSLGSPLASRFISRHVRGSEYSGARRYPSNIDHWVNVAARAEMTALHPELGPYYGEMLELGLLQTFEDKPDIYNHFHADFGLNAHKSYGYLANSVVAEILAAWLSGSTRFAAR